MDGRHLLWRCADAFQQLTAELGGEEIGTGGMYGFLAVCLKIHHRYGGVAFVAWEAKNRKDNFRCKLYPQYKDKGEPDEDTLELIRDMAKQEKRLMAMLRLMGVRQYMGVRCEADDVIGTLAKKFDGREVIIYSGDSDLRQLVTNTTTAVSPGYRGSRDVVYTSEAVEEKHGVPPKFIPDLKALAGDHSDNIPGVPGIGAVYAARAISAFGAVDEIIRAAKRGGDEWPLTEKLRQKLLENAKNARLFKKLTTIKCDATMQPITPARDKKRLIQHLMAYKFRSMMGPAELGGLMNMAGDW